GTFGRQDAVTTLASGAYEFTGIPVQADSFTLTARQGTKSVDAKARIEFHEQILPLDLDLLPNAISVPATLSDGNAISWTIRTDGSVQASPLSSLAGGSRLSLAQGAQAVPFVGRGQPGLEETEQGQREIVLHQEGLLGLKVTRKVFVPQDGYFV